MITNSKKEQLHIRLNTAQLDIISRAALVLDHSIPEFLFGAALKSAEEILMGSRDHLVGDGLNEELLRILDSPVSDNPELQRTLRKPAPWAN